MTETLITLQQVSKSFGDRKVLQPIDLSIKKGEFLTLLGPSGCGKTTLLRMISGLIQPDSGDLLINDQSVIHLPPNLRQVNTVFQSYALFPHMTVFDNVAFGLRCKKMGASTVKTRVMEALDSVKLSDFVTRKPSELSGGQQQRVAIARAIVNRPLALLLDEPLSALDYRLRKAMQIELKQLQRKLGITFVLVTHDQEEALSMSDTVVVLDGGTIQQIGPPREVYETPCNLTVAKFIGEVNIFDATVQAATEQHVDVTLFNQAVRLAHDGKYQMHERIHVLVRPEDFRIYGTDEVTDTKNMFPGTVVEVIYKGTTVDLLVRLDDDTIIAATEFFDEDDENLIYTIGESVFAQWMMGWEVILPYEH